MTGAIEESHYERCPDRASYAYITIYDGPVRDRNDIFSPRDPVSADYETYSLDPEELSKVTGVTATRIARRGDQRRNGRYSLTNSWELRSALPRDAAPHEHIKNVLDQMRPGWETFVKAMQTYFAIMHVVTEGQNPGMIVPLDEVVRLAEVGASLDIDAYGTDPSED